jgi:DNA-binding IclR family transcriptional regulator
MTSAANEGQQHAADLRARQPKAIHSAFVVLEEVARSGPGVTAREVSDVLGIPRATTYRLLNLLVQEEYLVRLPDLRGFALGRKVSRLAAAIEAELVLSRAAREVLGRARTRFRGGVSLVGYGGDRIQLVDVDPDHPLSDPLRIQNELAVSGFGRLLLSERQRRDRGGGEALAAHGDALAEITEHGYISRFEALRRGHGCLVMPVRDADGGLIAGVGLSGPSERIRGDPALIELLSATTTDLGPLLS